MRNLSVQAYRGWLIVWIALFHYTCRITEIYPSISFPFQFDNGGKVGVMFFFFVSGFFLCRGIMKFEQQNIKGVCWFVVNKYWRLWFPYVIAIIFIFIACQIGQLPGRTATVKDFLINSILIYHPKVGFVDSAHWFIGHLIIIQVIFSFFLLLKRGLRLYAILCYEFFCIVLLIINNCVEDSIANKCMGMLCIDSSLKVFLGFNLWSLLNCQWKEKMIYVHLIFFIALLTYFCITINIFLVFVYTIVTYIALCNKIPSKLLPYPLVFIGNVSFEWYLIHQNIGFLIIYYLYNKGMTDEIILMIPMFVTFLMGFIIKYLTKIVTVNLK